MPPLRRLLRWALIAFAALALLGAIALGTLYYLIAPKLPDVETLRNVEMQEPMYVYSRDGQLMSVFGETRRYPVAIDAVPLRLKLWSGRSYELGPEQVTIAEILKGAGFKTAAFVASFSVESVSSIGGFSSVSSALSASAPFLTQSTA